MANSDLKLLLDKRDSFVISNSLARANNALSLNALRFASYLISRLPAVKGEGSDWVQAEPINRIVKVDIREYAKHVNEDVCKLSANTENEITGNKSDAYISGNDKKSLDYCIDLLKKTPLIISIESHIKLMKQYDSDLINGLSETDILRLHEKGVAEVYWIDSVFKFDRDNNEAYIVLSQSIMPYLVKLKGEFSKFKIEYFLKFRSASALRCYMLFVSLLGNRKTVDIPLDDFRKTLNIKKYSSRPKNGREEGDTAKYYSNADIIRYVINPFVVEYNRIHESQIETESLKNKAKCNRIESIRFKIQSTETAKIKINHHSDIPIVISQIDDPLVIKGLFDIYSQCEAVKNNDADKYKSLIKESNELIK